ncbi:hypothetical protein [Roseivirga sp.]|uniref:EF-Tu C-terminal domain-related protein n=1 Tax=Roseivirga sp. TaxID=1964215 RepID=UPI003B8EAE57
MFTKEITDNNELYLYLNGRLIYKRWLNTGQSKVFDVMAYNKYTYKSTTDLDSDGTTNLIKVSAELRLHHKNEGGRSTGIFSGYRPDHVFNYNDEGSIEKAYIGDIQFEEPKIILPGETYKVTVRFLLYQELEKFLKPGREWHIHEGKNKIGFAKIIEFKLPDQYYI